MKRGASFVVAFAFLVLMTSASAKPEGVAVSAKCDPSWKLLPILESERDSITALTPLGNIFVSRNGAVYGAYQKWVQVAGKKTSVVALLYWPVVGRAPSQPVLGYAPRAKAGGFVVSYVTAIGSSGPGIAVGGYYVTAHGSAALDHKLPLFFEWDGRNLTYIPLDPFGEGRILAVNGGWATGSTVAGQPIMLHRETNGWKTVPFPEELLPKDLDGKPRGYFNQIEARGVSNTLFVGESGSRRIAFLWDGVEFILTTALPEESVVTPPTRKELRRLGIGPPRFIKTVGNNRWSAAYGYDRKQTFVLRRRTCEAALATSG